MVSKKNKYRKKIISTIRKGVNKLKNTRVAKKNTRNKVAKTAKKKSSKFSKKGRGLLRFFEDKTEYSCSEPVKYCFKKPAHEGNCREYYYYDSENNLYRPCRNPENKGDYYCRETAKTFNYKCKDRDDNLYEENMENFDKMDQLNMNIRLRIQDELKGTYSTTEKRVDTIEQYVERLFKNKGITPKFEEEFKTNIDTDITNPIKEELQQNSRIVSGDIDIINLYRILERVQIYNFLEKKFDERKNEETQSRKTRSQSRRPTSQSIPDTVNREKNYYQLLGISQDATVSQIKKAYKQLILYWHPDKCNDEKPDKLDNNIMKNCEEQIRIINNIYEILIDPDKKNNYDITLYSGKYNYGSRYRSPSSSRYRSPSSSRYSPYR